MTLTSFFFAFTSQWIVAGGAIVMEWNVHDPPGQQAAASMFDSHIVLVGRISDLNRIGTNNCLTGR